MVSRKPDGERRYPQMTFYLTKGLMKPRSQTPRGTRIARNHHLNRLAPAGRSARRSLEPSAVQIRSIVVPIDFSTASEKALAYAGAFARQFGATLVLIHVLERIGLPDFEKTFPLLLEPDQLVPACKRRLEQLMKKNEIEPELVERVLVRPGRSFDEIATVARTLNADLIIISTHGYTGWQHALLGSTTERVVRYAPCPVLVVRERQRDLLHKSNPNDQQKVKL